jgi:outer membrane protein TolC
MRYFCAALLLACCLQEPVAQQRNLDYYLSRGLRNSPLLADYWNQMRSVILDSMRIGAEQKLQVNGRSMNYYAPVVKGWGYDEVITDGANVSAVVEVSKQFVGRNNLLTQYRSLELQNQSTYLKGRISEQELRKNIIEDYINAYGSQQQYRVNKEVLGILQEGERLVKELTEKGIYKQTEYLSLLIGFRQQELLTDKNYNQCQTDIGNLNSLCGIYDTAWVILPEPGLTAYFPPDVLNSVFYQQFVTDSLKLATTDRLIDYSYRPKLSAYLDGGYFSSMAYTPWKNFGASIGLNLTVPIYDGHQKQMQHDQVTIQEQNRTHYRDFFANQYRQQTEMLLRQMTANKKLVRQAGEQLAFARTLVDANRILLSNGDISITDFLISVNNYLNARNLEIDNILSGYHIINELNYWSKTK